MGQPTLLQNIRWWLAGIAFDMYLWLSGLTADRFHQIWQEQILGEISEFFTPPMRYWQHDETGRVCAKVLQPNERWYEIKKGDYEAIAESARLEVQESR